MKSLNVFIDDSLDERFRAEVFRRIGLRKGALKDAVTEAIEMWLGAPTTDVRVVPVAVSSDDAPVDPRSGKQIQRLSEDPEAKAAIKELWAAGHRNRKWIAEQVGHKERTVQQYIKDCLDSGELVV